MKKTNLFFIFAGLFLLTSTSVFILGCEKEDKDDDNGGHDPGLNLHGSLTQLGEKGNTFTVDFDEPLGGVDLDTIMIVSTDGERSNVRGKVTIENPLLGEMANVLLNRHPELISSYGNQFEVNVGLKFTEDGVSFLGTGEGTGKSSLQDPEQVIMRYDAKVGDVFTASFNGRTERKQVVSVSQVGGSTVIEAELIEHNIPNLISLRTFHTKEEGLIGGVALLSDNTEVSFGVTSAKPNEPVDFGDHDFGSMTDPRDGNTYKTIQIGNQVWMAENLAYLPSVAEETTGSFTTPYYYVYGYDGTDTAAAKATDNYQTYGVLYNWPAAMNSSASSSTNPSGVQGVCPPGWHLPSDEEWTQLTDYLGGVNEAGGKLKATGTTHWESPNTDASNESGFTALPGGYHADERFRDIGSYGYWWSATENNADYAFYRVLLYSLNRVYRFNSDKEMGLAVRCVKDN